MSSSTRKESLINSANQLINEAIAWAHSMPDEGWFKECNQGARIQMKCTIDTFDSTDPYLIIISQYVKIHESIRRQGICRRFFSELEKSQSTIGIIIHQSVQNRYLRSRHYRNGFIRDGNDWKFYKRIGPPLKKDHRLYKRFMAEGEGVEARKNISADLNIGLGGRRKNSVDLSFTNRFPEL